jgi:hypothetical protein
LIDFSDAPTGIGQLRQPSDKTKMVPSSDHYYDSSERRNRQGNAFLGYTDYIFPPTHREAIYVIEPKLDE